MLWSVYFSVLTKNLVQVREYTFLWLFLLLIIFRASCDFICFSQAGTFLVFTLDFLPLNLWVCWKWEKITAWSYKSLNTKYKLRKFRGCWGHAEKKKKKCFTWKLFFKPCQGIMVSLLILFSSTVRTYAIKCRWKDC